MRQHLIPAENSVIALGRSELKLGFGQIERALWRLHNVLPERVSAFRARLRYLQRADYGIPRSGGGRKANFTIGHAVLFELGIELQQFGLTPTHVAELINTYRDELMAGLQLVCKTPGSEDVLLFFYPTALSFLEMPDGEEGSLAVRILQHGSADGDLATRFLRGPEALHRAAFINLAMIVEGLISKFATQSEEAAYYAELSAWASRGGAD